MDPTELRSAQVLAQRGDEAIAAWMTAVVDEALAPPPQPDGTA
ncbi:hypothetical protein [Ideonella sp. B508-1]|nr:hypothetical protein [Ideonella sp. B508-1]